VSIKKGDKLEGFKPTKISFSMGYTVNTGNFNSLRVDCGIEMDISDPGTLEEAEKESYEWIERTLQGRVVAQTKKLKKGE
jgi:hypothetical protein